MRINKKVLFEKSQFLSWFQEKFNSITAICSAVKGILNQETASEEKPLTRKYAIRTEEQNEAEDVLVTISEIVAPKIMTPFARENGMIESPFDPVAASMQGNYETCTESVLQELYRVNRDGELVERHLIAE